ncbi:hypothetical protein GCM10008164_35780 [Achromobacter xylosoxidans]|nr:hypothetical protein GCM10008164_35780 [Achromobacter xylosoxidans]
MSLLVKKGYTRLAPGTTRTGTSAMDTHGFSPFSTYGARMVGALSVGVGAHPGSPIGDTAPLAQEVCQWEGEGGSIVGFAGVSRLFVFSGSGALVHWPVLAWCGKES